MRSKHVLLLLALAAPALAGCLGGDDDAPEPSPTGAPALSDGVFVTGADGNATDGTPLGFTFRLSDVGAEGAEPNVGVTSSGCIFFTAFEKVMRSCDHGDSWEEVQDPLVCQDGTSDPYLWVDAATDRIFNVQMVDLVTTWVCWSDDDGETWLGNPYDSGPIPVNDHIKIGTGPWTSSGYGLIGSADPIYSQAVYFCYNKLVGVFCYTSFDGGMTFPIGGQAVGLASTDGGLHGSIETAPDGTVYVPPRTATPMAIYSKDNGLTWTSVTLGQDAGTPDPRKNSELATDTASNAYYTWTGADQGVYLSRSIDSGVTWDQTSLRVSPIKIVSSTFPQIDAGDPGRIAIAYLGSQDGDLLGSEDIDGNEWNGNAQFAPAGVTYDLYVTYSLNALDAEPTFTTVRVTDDPVQAGSICLNSSECRDIGGSNRNLLDFNDLHIDQDGRVYIAYADGCTGECAEKADPQPEDSRSRAGMVAILEDGPSLYESVSDLAWFQ